MNVLLRIQCSSDRNKGKLVVAKSGEYGRCGRISHPNKLIFSLFSFAECGVVGE